MKNKPVVKQKGRFGLSYRGTECANCEHPLDISDKYCPNCSQANSTKKLTLLDFFDEFLASLISYDSKLLKTLSALLLRPGKITNDFIKGKRVSYTNPFRFLLSLSIIYFLLQSLTNDVSRFDRYGAGKSKSIFDENNFMSFSGEDDAILDSLKLENSDANRFLSEIDSLNISEIVSKRDSIIMTDPKEHFKKTEEHAFWERFIKKREIFNAVIQADDVYEFDEISPLYDIRSTNENKGSFKAAQSYLRFAQQPGSFLSSIISKLPFAVFFFLPVFTLFIWLTYIRKKYTYTEHLIFSFHNQSLLFILLIISFLIDAAFKVNSGWIFIIIFSIYLFQAMRKFYEQGFFKTTVKYVLLNTIFFFLAIFATILLFAGSLFTY